MTNDHNSSWRHLSSRVVHQNPWFQVREDRVIRPDGTEGPYFVVDTRGPAVFIVALTDTQEVVLIRQHRYPTNDIGWELPSGNAEQDELLVAAKRELREETGYSADRWQELGGCDSMSGVCSERMHVFLARVLRTGESAVQHDEGILEVRAFPWTQIQTMLASGEINNGQTIASLALAAPHLSVLS